MVNNPVRQEHVMAYNDTVSLMLPQMKLNLGRKLARILESLFYGCLRKYGPYCYLRITDESIVLTKYLYYTTTFTCSFNQININVSTHFFELN